MLSITVAIGLFLFVSLVIVVMFENIFRDFGVPLPRLTVAMIVVSQFARSAWPAFAIICAALLGFWIFMRLFLKPAQRRSLVTRIPVLGRVWKFVSWAEFCHLLALLLESRLPLPEALQLTGEGVENCRSGPGLSGDGRPTSSGEAAWPRPCSSAVSCPPACPGFCGGPATTPPEPRSCTWSARCSRPGPAARPPSPVR